MIEILLTRGYSTVVDDEDYYELSQYRWHTQTGKQDTIYAARKEDGKHILMHRQILCATDGILVDHKDGNGLNNRRANLRFATKGQNQANSRTRDNKTSRFRGVCWHNNRAKWIAQINTPYGAKNLDGFDNEEDAAKAYDKAALKRFGEFARLNFSGEV